MIFVGIDPGVNTGFSVSENGVLRCVDTVKACEAEKMVLNMFSCADGKIIVHVEDARLRTWFGGMDERQRKHGAGVREGVGSVKRDSQRWHEFLAYHEIPHVLIAPKNNKTKMDAAQFKRLTGWKKRTSKHGRDAAMLVLGR